MILLILKRLGNMPLLSTIFKTILVIFLLLSATIFFILKVNYAKQLQFKEETISIFRNQYGMPYVKAPSFQSAMYGWGYATAQDRLFQLSFKRLIGKGKLSKYLGKKALNVDKIFRQLNFNYWAEKTAENMKKQNITEYQNYQNYVQGFNDHVKSLKILPIQFHLIGLEWQQWQISDIFLISKLLVWSQSQNMAQQYIRSSLLSNYTVEQIQNMFSFRHQQKRDKNFITIVSDQQLTRQTNLLNLTLPLNVPEFDPVNVQSLYNMGVMQYLDDGRGSNSWVINGNLTQSGSPLIANDPHLQSAIPHQWHQIKVQYLHKGKTVYIQGSSMTGIPIIVGKTNYSCVALTTTYSDSQDLFREQIQDNFYILDGKKIPLKQRKQIIQIQNEEAIQYIVKQTHRGPIINFIVHHGKIYELNQNQSLSLAWTGFHDQYQTFVTYSHIAEVDNINDLRNFMIKYTDYGPSMNVLYSTNDNHIGYIAIGSLPLRRNPFSGGFIKDGSSTSHDWIDLIQQQKKLNIHDPIKGYIVTANNKPVSSLYQNGVFQTSIYTARGNRINQLLLQKINKNQKLTMNDMKRIQLDTVDVICQENIPFLLKGIKKASQYLKDFNCDFTKISYQATIYEVFYYQLYLIINPDKTNNFNLLSNLHFFHYLYDYSRNYTDKQVHQNLKEAFDNTIKNLTLFFNTDRKEVWIWENYHPDLIIHRPFSGSEVLKPFYQKKFGGRGNINTVNVAKMNKLSYGDFTVYHRANIRQIFSHKQKSYWIGDTGVNQKFYSKHYDDQYKHFIKDQYIEINFQPKFIQQKPEL